MEVVAGASASIEFVYWHMARASNSLRTNMVVVVG